MKKILTDIFDIAKTVLIVFVVAYTIRYFLFQPFVVDGHSMDPNLTNAEYLIVNKLSYKLHEPKRGDIIVFTAPGTPEYDYIKRIIGLPGEKISIKNSKLYINDTLFKEEYLDKNITTTIQGNKKATLEVTLSENEYFVLGDNRDHSSDSRVWGPLPKENIIGKAWFVVYPLDYFGSIRTPDYKLSF